MKVSLLWVTILHASIRTQGQSFDQVEPPKNWYSALNYCKSIDKELKMSKTRNHLDLQIFLQPDEMYWLGGRKTSSPWTWTDGSPLYTYKGCYRGSEIASTRGQSSDSNTADQCFLTCGGRYVGLQGTDCLCLRGAPQLPSAPHEDCSLPCPGDLEGECGGEDAVSVYEDASNAFPWSGSEFETNKDCAYLDRPWNAGSSLDAILMKTDQCDHTSVLQKPSMCRTCRSPQSCRITRQASYRTWKAANASCALAKVTAADEIPFQFTLRTQEYYWIGLSRQTRWTWIDGSDISVTWMEQTGADCLAARADSKGRIFLQARACADNLRFICSDASPVRTVQTITSSTQTSSSEPTTTPRATSTTPTTMRSSTRSTTTRPMTSSPTSSSTQQTTTESTTISSTSTTSTQTISKTTTEKIRTSEKSTSQTEITARTPHELVFNETSASMSSMKTPNSQLSSQSTMPTKLPRKTTESSRNTSPLSVTDSSRVVSTESFSTSGTNVAVTSATEEYVRTDASSPTICTDDKNLGLYIGLGAVGGLILIMVVIIACTTHRRNRRHKKLLYHVNGNSPQTADTPGLPNTPVSPHKPDYPYNSMQGTTERRVRLQSLKDIEFDALYSTPQKASKQHRYTH